MNRYSRQILMPEIGEAGQKTLAKSNVLLIGIGGLGSPVAMYLAAAGVGRIGLMDDDRVDLTNLQRQILFGEDDVGTAKPVAAKRRLQELRSDLRVTIETRRLRAEGAIDLFRDYDVIVDGTDRFESKFLVNDAALAAGKPVVAAGVSGFEGWLGVFGWNEGPCYRCWVPEEPRSTRLSCRESGVLAPAAGVMGSLQAVEVIKILLAGQDSLSGTRDWRPLSGRLIAFDFSTMDVRSLKLAARPDCICRGDRSRIQPVERNSPVCGAGEREAPSGHQGGAILDVREDDEWQCEPGIAGSFHWPLSLIMSGEEPPAFMRAADQWLVTCQHGQRSMKAAYLLGERFPDQQFVGLAGGLSGRRSD